jgi:hypothetical protein
MSALVFLGMSLTLDQVPFPAHPDDANTLHPASTHCAYPAGLTAATRQMELAEIMNYNYLTPPRDVYGVSGLSAPPDSASAMIADTLSSLLAESYTQSGVQDDYTDASSLPQGQVEGTTLSPVATRGQSAITQRRMKKEKDVERQRGRRFDDEQGPG